MRSISGGVSNVSFSFRGNNPVREAIHAVFLYHAIKAGMDMGIVNAGQLAIYEEIPAELRERVEDVVLNRRADATERLLEIAAKYKGDGSSIEKKEDLAWRELPVVKRLEHALVKGIDAFVEQDTEECRLAIRAPHPGHRRPADGRHERRRRSVRRRQDVPAAGGEVRARDEKGRRASVAVHRSRERRHAARPKARS